MAAQPGSDPAGPGQGQGPDSLPGRDHLPGRLPGQRPGRRGPDRVLRTGAPIGTVVLDLGAAATLDPETCAAILLMHQRLTAIGTRLRLAASARGLIDCLAGAGVAQQLGRDTIHASFRGAVLAVYAAQPGPGLAVGRIRTELEMQAETIELLLPHRQSPDGQFPGCQSPGRRAPARAVPAAAPQSTIAPASPAAGGAVPPRTAVN